MSKRRGRLCIDKTSWFYSRDISLDYMHDTCGIVHLSFTVKVTTGFRKVAGINLKRVI